MANYLKLPELARRLSVSEKTARRMVKAGKLPAVFIGNAYRVREEDAEAYLEGAKFEPAGGPALFSPEELAADAQNTRDARAHQEAGGQIIALSDEDDARLMERVREGNVRGIEAEAEQLAGMYRKALGLDGPDGDYAPRLADALASVLAARALARGGDHAEIKAAILRALAACEGAPADATPQQQGA